MSATMTSAPFTQAVVRAMRRLYPESLADGSWDNTGLLLEAPFTPSRRQANRALLTVDLTKAVADEAIATESSIVIAYHPIIFKGLKALTFANTQQKTLLRLASHGISVYSPHTAVDAAPGGLGDWLADIVTGTKTGDDGTVPATGSQPHAGRRDDPDDPFSQRKRPRYTLSHHPTQPTIRWAEDPFPAIVSVSHERSVIVPQSPEVLSHVGSGMGRIVQFDQAQTLAAILDRVGKGLNNPKGFPIAIPQGKTISNMIIKTVGICAGSGASILSNLDVDLLFTGEMSHHDALAAIEKGQVVISLFHSNSERGFLVDVLKGQLETTVHMEWSMLRRDTLYKRELQEALADEDFEITVSTVDRDPYGIVVLKTEMEDETGDSGMYD